MKPNRYVSLELLPEPFTLIPLNALLPTLSPKLHYNQTGVTILEVKDLRQTIAIEMGYEETNTWLEWINLFHQHLNKLDCYVCAAGTLDSE
jgi:hypothetical protein